MKKLEANLNRLKKIAEDYIKPIGSHNFEHTLRVFNTCSHIGYQMNADMSILLYSALLHDIGRTHPHHALAGSKIAEKVLRELRFNREQIDKICDAIETHSFSGQKKPKTLEAKILSDADKLDAMGAIGIYRTAAYTAEKGRKIEESIQHFHTKLLKLKDSLYTDIAKELAVSRHGFMKDFLSQIERELKICA